MNKFILDACCAGRQIWFQKEQKNTIFMDIREEKKGVIKLQPNWSIEPTIIGDYRNMPFPDKSFKLVVWDIPHKLKEDKGIIEMKYGHLGENYKEDLKIAFNEIMRVLDDYAILEFKFADISVSIKKILDLFPIKPLFGTVTKKGVNNTYWFCFMKIPEELKIERDNTREKLSKEVLEHCKSNRILGSINFPIEDYLVSFSIKQKTTSGAVE